MKKILLVTLSLLTFNGLFAQDGCFDRLNKAFEKRGAYTVSDDMHRNVILSFFTPDGQECLNGKVRVENGAITAIFIQYNEGDYELLDRKFTNAQKTAPKISNGISEMIHVSDGQKVRVVFIDKLKPKQREYKSAELPSDL
jgi:hypothetical protein